MEDYSKWRRRRYTIQFLWPVDQLTDRGYATLEPLISTELIGCREYTEVLSLLLWVSLSVPYATLTSVGWIRTCGLSGAFTIRMEYEIRWDSRLVVGPITLGPDHVCAFIIRDRPSRSPMIVTLSFKFYFFPFACF